MNCLIISVLLAAASTVFMEQINKIKDKMLMVSEAGAIGIGVKKMLVKRRTDHYCKLSNKLLCLVLVFVNCEVVVVLVFN